MVSVDTNVLVRIATQDEPQQTAEANNFIAVGGAWVSHLVLAETVWVLGSSYNRTHAELLEAIEILLSHEHLILEKPEVIKEALSTFNEYPSIGFSDCLILAIARKAGHLPLGTFDRGLAKLAGTQII